MRPYLKDADDDFILELAFSSAADYIITYNTDNFKLSKTFGVEVITPKTFLQKKGHESKSYWRNTMTELKIRLPDKLHQKLCEISEMQNIPIDEIIAASLAQKLFRIMPDSYLEERAKRATGEGFSVVLSQVPDVPPEDYDRL